MSARQHKSILNFTIAAIIFVLCSCTVVMAEPLPKTASLVPPETVFLADVDNFGQLRNQFEKTSFYKLYKDPAMAGFVEDFKTKVKQKIQQLDENNIVKVIFDTDAWPQGRAAVALVLNEQTKDSNEPAVLIITQWGETIEKIKDAVTKMRQKNIELGGHQKPSQNYRGVSIETSIDETSQQLNYCFIDDYFIAATNLELLKFVVAHIKGASSPTLADSDDYTAAMKTVRPGRSVGIDFYINIKQLIKTVIAGDTADTARTAVANLGFDNVSAFACSLSFAPAAGSSYHGRAFLKIDGPKKGLCRMLDAESASLRAPQFIPASACAVTFFNLDVKRAYDQLANILSSFSPKAAAVMYMPLLPPSPDGSPGLELKADIINHLGSQIIFAQSINRPLSAASSPSEYLVALAVNNPIALEKSLSLLHSRLIAPGDPEAKRQLLGRTIYLVNFRRMPFFPSGRLPMQTPADQSAEQKPKLAFAVTDTHIIFGPESTVERAIRTLNSDISASIVSSKWFNSAKSAIPSVVGLASLEDSAASGELLWYMLKQSAKDSGSNSVSAGISISSAGPNPALLMFSQSGLFNPALLPPFDAVRKYFGLSASYGISRPDGFFFEFENINP